jgi:hypothetical protein
MPLMFDDYDFRFFFHEHYDCRKPPRGPDAESGIVSVAEGEPGFEALTPDKRWRPDQCPDYIPPQTPIKRPYEGDVRELLIGIWTNSSLGSHSEEQLIFFPDGRGILEYWNVVFCNLFRFRWRVEQERHLDIDESAEGGNLVVSYLGCREHRLARLAAWRRFRIEIIASVDRYGDTTDILRVNAEPPGSLVRAFYRVAQNADGYQTPERESP